MSTLETDYLIIGAGAAGLAFADTLLTESPDTHITIVDLRSQVGGHWNDAYPFVALHQPSSFYGVNSLELGTGRKYASGVNAGMYEMATGTQVTAYFQRVMEEQLLPSGRVVYRPMSRFVDGNRIVSLLSGAETPLTIRRKVVDATRFSPRVPATEAPPFKVAMSVRVCTPTGLAHLWLSARDGAGRPDHYCIVGAGKTGMDTGVWLLDQGVPPEQISWVMPRDSWIVNRVTTQNGPEFFDEAIGGAVRQLQALAEASSVDDLFLRLEAAGQMLRLDPQVMPRMCHFATISEGELAQLRRIPHIIRKGRVQAVDAQGLNFASG
ncbi:MAG TPA: NAD(P)-binding protein, partial [Casimicrobium huifangae]|nr:NAD(P)-binding protein [Casimicrobium huifangae]